jgi:hypothetical protein
LLRESASAERTVCCGANKIPGGHEAAEFGIFSLVDHTHAALAELLTPSRNSMTMNDDCRSCQFRKSCRDHWGEVLGLDKGQVNEGEELVYVPKRQLMKHRHYTH